MEQEEQQQQEREEGDDEERYAEDYEDEMQEEDREDPNCGFRAFDADEEEERRKVKEIDNSPEAMELRDKIIQLVSRYPELKPRSSFATMIALERYSAIQLKNIYNNALNDLQSVRGTPSSEVVINFIGMGVEKMTHLRNYREMCVADKELNRDVEAELHHILFWAGTKAQIMFRFMNNAFKCYYGLDATSNIVNNEEHESERARQRGIASIFDEQDASDEEKRALKEGYESRREETRKKRNATGEASGSKKRITKRPKRPTENTTSV